MTVRDAPLPRTWIDDALPWLRATLGAAFVAFSANSTVFIGAADLQWLFSSTQQVTIGGVPDAFWYSSLLALIFFVGEVVTAERYPRVYQLFLIPDTLYTARGMHGGVAPALGVLLGLGPPGMVLGWVLAWPICLGVGYLVARWGEDLLFGKRRRISRRRMPAEGAE